MRALTLIPRHSGSLSLEDRPDPQPAPGELLVDAIAMGVCGTDREIVRGDYGWAPTGSDRLVLGHESLVAARTPTSRQIRAFARRTVPQVPWQVRLSTVGRVLHDIVVAGRADALH